MLKLFNRVNKELSIEEAYGDPKIRAGNSVYIEIEGLAEISLNRVPMVLASRRRNKKSTGAVLSGAKKKLVARRYCSENKYNKQHYFTSKRCVGRGRNFVKRRKQEYNFKQQ